MTDRFRLVPAAYVLFRRQSPGGEREVLLQYRSGTGFMDDHWACGAAGHVEAEESVYDAAVREAREELGVTITAEDLVPLTVVHRRHEDAEPVNQRVDFWFACDRTPDRAPAIQEPDRSAALEWFALDDLPEPVVPHEEAVLIALREGDLPHLMSRGFDTKDAE